MIRAIKSLPNTGAVSVLLGQFVSLLNLPLQCVNATASGTSVTGSHGVCTVCVCAI